MKRRKIGPEERLRGRDDRETVVGEALAASVLVVAAAAAASASGAAFSFRIREGVKCLVPEKISLGFLENEEKKKKTKKKKGERGTNGK